MTSTTPGALVSRQAHTASSNVPAQAIGHVTGVGGNLPEVMQVCNAIAAAGEFVPPAYRGEQDMSKINRIPIAEFRALGFLQEANRLFFHPLGLALEVSVSEDGTESLGGVWDYRDDPEGIVFGEGQIDLAKTAAVDAERERHRVARSAMLGCHDGIQRS